MTNIRIYVCSLCNQISKAKSNCLLSISRGKGKDRELRKVEICATCFSKLLLQIDSEFDLNAIFNKKPDREQIIPSNAQNMTTSPINKCQHDSTSYEPPNIICKICKEEWPA